MMHFATESGKSKGQFYTPAEVSRIMAKVVGIGPETRQDQTIYDPTCGSGSLLLKAVDEAPKGISVCGQEMDNATWSLARMNLILHGEETAEVWRGNTLSNPYFKSDAGNLKTHDFAVANPPFSFKSCYTGEAFEAYDSDDVAGLLKDRLKQARERLGEAREAVKALCEAVEPPKDSTAYFHYFCATESGNADQLKANEPKRLALYKMAAAYLRAYADIANEMQAAGYTVAETKTIRDEVEHFAKAREEVKLGSGDHIDFKRYEPDMRHLLDTYIHAGESSKISAFDELPLVQLIIERGEDALASLPDGIRGSKEATAETIENNVRRLIIDERAVNPRYYEHMSTLLEELIAERKRQALDYQAYLAKIVELARKIARPDRARYPQAINSGARQAIFDLLRDWPGLDALLAKLQAKDSGATTAESAALAVDDAIRKAKMADFRGHPMKEKKVRNAIRKVLPDEDLADELFAIAKAQRDY